MNKSSKGNSNKNKRVTTAWFIALATVSVLALVFSFIYEVSDEEVVTSAVPYTSTFEDEAAMELGNQEVIQDGQDGIKYITYEVRRTLFDRLFRKNNYIREIIDSGISEEPVEKIVVQGTRKWQYMMCSDQTYRYYTDEQFENKFTGFTNSSPDYCAKNNNGTRVSLADAPSGVNNTVAPTYIPPSCTTTEIPYSTVYEDASWLYIGETEQGFEGSNGARLSCTDDSLDVAYDPVNKVIYRGTKEKETYSAPTWEPQPDPYARQRCTNEYNSAKVQLSVMGASDSSAMLQIQRLYSQCLNRAGY